MYTLQTKQKLLCFGQIFPSCYVINKPVLILQTRSIVYTTQNNQIRWEGIGILMCKFSTLSSWWDGSFSNHVLTVLSSRAVKSNFQCTILCKVKFPGNSSPGKKNFGGRWSQVGHFLCRKGRKHKTKSSTARVSEHKAYTLFAARFLHWCGKWIPFWTYSYCSCIALIKWLLHCTILMK